MKLSRRWAAFLAVAGVWNWIIWPRFAVAIWNDSRAWSGGQVGQGSFTAFWWVHAALIAASLAIGTTVGALGVRALFLSRRRPDLAETGSSHAEG
jgi:hypothetical protein